MEAPLVFVKLFVLSHLCSVIVELLDNFLLV